MDTRLTGIHHVTAITGNAQRNVDFYAGVLGLRLVKRTVNFDDPNRYHLYYGDDVGRPGTLLTFFVWPGGSAGRQGSGQIASVSLSIPPASLSFWIERLLRHGLAYQGPTRRFDERVLTFRDPEGLQLEIVAHPAANQSPGWSGGTVEAEHAIRGLHTVTLWEDGTDPTASFLTATLGFRLVAEDQRLLRYAIGQGGPGAIVDVRNTKGFWEGGLGVASIHHVAWRTPDDESLEAWQRNFTDAGLEPTPIRDRYYFRSVYVREPGQVLFEIATDGPGFTRDEPAAELGQRLALPPWLEPNRPRLEAELPELHVPRPGAASEPH